MKVLSIKSLILETLLEFGLITSAQNIEAIEKYESLSSEEVRDKIDDIKSSIPPLIAQYMLSTKSKGTFMSVGAEIKHNSCCARNHI